MNKKGGVYIFIAILTAGLFFLAEYNKPKTINWFPSYVSQHKIPYGTYVFNNLIREKFPNKVKSINEPPFEFLKESNTVDATYIFINDKVNFGKEELNTILEWTAKGNSLIVASDHLENKLLDTLHLEHTTFFDSNDIKPVFYHNLVNNHLDSSKKSFEKDYSTMVFSKIDTLHTIVLGEVTIEGDKAINVIKQPFEKGTIILSTFPKAFTNYFILKEKNSNYTAGLLSYVDPEKSVFLDQHHKSGKTFYTSPMYIFLNTKEFKWAYYLVLVGALIYIVFEGKRKQRPVPVIRPLKNQTLAFTRTIGDMYFETGQQKEIAKHKITHFLEYIRSHFYISTENIDSVFYQNLASRSNHTKEGVEKLFNLFKKIEVREKLTDKELQDFNKKIEDFKTKVDGKQ